MLLLTIDRKSPMPIYRQIIDAIVTLVDGGTLSPGDRLPPSRTLAKVTGIHRSSVTRAYEELWALGYLESRPGSYSTVRRRLRRLRTGERARPLLDWSATVVPTARAAEATDKRMQPERAAICSGPRLLDFSPLTADPRLCPERELRRCFRTALDEGGQALGYGAPAGHLPLRETIASRLRTHGVDVSVEEIIITNGAQQGLDLLLRMLARPGATVVVETPGYSAALPLFRLQGLDVIGVPMRPGGMDLDVVEGVLARRRPALLYTMPNFQNPTGITTSQAHRERLLALCEKHRLPIIEDGFEEEMKYYGKAVLPIKSMDRGGLVAYLGTLSKVAFPGLRIGWIAAPKPLVDIAQSLQRFCCHSGNVLSQSAVQRFMASGGYEAHLRRLHKIYRKRMQAMLDGLRAHLPKRGVSFTEPQGGYTLWLRVTGAKLTEATIHERLLAAGVRLSSGRFFHTRARAEPCFRVCIACRTVEEIDEGSRRIGRVLRVVVEG